MLTRFTLPAFAMLSCTFGEIRLNEFMASNVRSFPNASDFDDYPDWIEIHNTSQEQRLLSHYYLSDDPANPRKWPFPQSALIGPGEHLVIVADGYDQEKGFTDKRSYFPRQSFTTLFHHTNFKLSAEGEEILLSHEPRRTETIIPPGSDWSYHEGLTDPGENWSTLTFNASSWKSGQAPFGYHSHPGWPIATKTSFGEDENGKHTTTYFRKTFDMVENSTIWWASLNYQTADGAVIYLNGVEVARHNLPAGTINHTTPAEEEVPPTEQPVKHTIQLPADQIRSGRNVIAVEVHRAQPDGPDHFFDSSFRIDAFDEDTFEIISIDTAANGNGWSFLDTGAAPPAFWSSASFNDETWESGPAPLGYSQPREVIEPGVTQISFGVDPENKAGVTYFRKRFEVESLTNVRELNLRLQVDDGAYFFLNGDEIHRENVEPTLPVDLVDGERPWNDITLSADALRAGTNILAVAVIQDGPETPSMRFDASLGIITVWPIETIDHLAFGTQVADISLGRDPLNPERWHYQAAPSPGEANSGPVVSNIRETSGEVTIEPPGGLHAVNPVVTLSTSAGEIRFTTDGTQPTADSPVFTAAIEIGENTVIRARVFEDGKVPGPIATSTYLVGENFTEGLPILSVTAPPDTLFDPGIGIYGYRSRGGGHVRKGIDAPGHLEFFPPDGSQGFSVSGGFRLGGENNFMSHGQKALNFATRGRYGDDAISYDLFPGSGVGRFTALTLREGGDDWGKAHLTDAIFDPIAKGRLEVETNRYRPVSLYLNGEYWGLYNLRDRWDENWFFQEYGTDDGKFDHVRVDSKEAENGSREDWDQLLSFLQNNEASDPEIWAIVESKVDIDSLIDFVICESYGRNSSWRGNREWWRDHRRSARWRWFIPDMDRTFGNTSTRPVLGSMLTQETTLRHVRKAPRFIARFAQRASAHLAETLSEDRIRSLINRLGATAGKEIPRQFERWGRPSSETYDEALERMKTFATDRSKNYLGEVRDRFDLEAPISLTLATQGGGRFRVAGIPLNPQTLNIFPNLETEIEALPLPGYRFVRWSDIRGEAKTTAIFGRDITVTAHFAPDASTPLSGELTDDLILTSAHSPYVITSDLNVPAGHTLTIEAGVALEFQKGVHLRIKGALVVNGTSASKVHFRGRHGATWGGVSLEQPDLKSKIAHLNLRGASRGHDPVRYPSAISGLDAQITLDFVDIGESRGPLFFRGGSMTLRDSILDIPLTGDGVNVKQGMATTLRCTFSGNGSPDTDAIDYDGVVDGVIQDCRIYDFSGFNSDGIDVGEQCRNCLVEGNVIFYNSDKGISVGQNSQLILRRNLIVGCQLGIAVKDEGSSVILDQNTIVDCTEGVALYEKNFGDGGGLATITNTLFSGCAQPITADSFSSFTVSHSLSDTLALPGGSNLLGDPLFVDPSSSNFELSPDSPAIDAGDPSHPVDPDGSRADIGALYRFSRDDYPYDLTPTVVVNELLAHSGENSDWLELHNRSLEAIDLSGWFLSDSASNLRKFRIAPGTIIPPGGFLTFTEADHFGESSSDPGRLEAFGLSKTGETVYLSSAVGDQLTYYRFNEEFGASLEGQSLGFHYKDSSESYNFVPMANPTPGAANALPQVGPVVISEIMYHGEVEYLELVNISPDPVTLADPAAEIGWRIKRGITWQFPGTNPVVLAPGERLILTEDEESFQSTYAPGPALQLFEWPEGKLDNAGETVQLDRPGPLDSLGSRSFVRVDRVKYDEHSPWDEEADGRGKALARIQEDLYGNDFINWRAQLPSPGWRNLFTSYSEWADFHLAGDRNLDVDGDGLSNLFEYAFGRDPLVADNPRLVEFVRIEDGWRKVRIPFEGPRPDLQILLEYSDDLVRWTSIQTIIQNGYREATVGPIANGFFRIRIVAF